MEKYIIIIVLFCSSFVYSQKGEINETPDHTIVASSITNNINIYSNKSEILSRMDWSDEYWNEKVAKGVLSSNEKIKIKAIIDSLRSVRLNESSLKE